MAQLAPSDASGAYERPPSAFLSSAPALRGRPALFIGVACGWCHRVMLARALLGLEEDLRVVRLVPGNDGLWRVADGRERARWGERLRDVYLTCSAGTYKGRSTAPLLVSEPMGSDGEAEIISNESSDILQLLPSAFDVERGRKVGEDGAIVWLRPEDGNEYGVDPVDVEEVCTNIYENVNNGVYKCGFATTQKAYEAAEERLFRALDSVEERLTRTRFLCSGLVLTEADIRLFPTVFRFDACYGNLFRVSRKSIHTDYPAIAGWMRDLYAMPGVSETCDLEATRTHYYTSLFMLNPGGVVPVGRSAEMSKPQNRTGLGVLKQGDSV